MIGRSVRHFAAKLTDYSRGKGLKIHENPCREAQRIYEEQAKDKLPLTEAEFREVISAEYMVFGRKGLGGPQPAELQRALAQAGQALQLDHDRRSLHHEELAAAQAERTAEFANLV